MEHRRAITGKLAEKYRGAKGRKQRSEILQEVQELTGYERHYAAFLLRNYGKRRVLTDAAGHTVALVVGQKNKRRGTPRPRLYDEAVRREVEFLWKLFDQMCGKRLVAMMADVLPALLDHRRVQQGSAVHEKLQCISASTVDRMLRAPRQRCRLKGIGHTKPTSLLKAQIPIVISSELDRLQPGHYQIDLVGHDGGNPNGQFAFSFNAIELSSGWVEPRVMLNKAQRWSLEALTSVQQQSPLPLKSLHSDNDGAFLNELLQRWCQQHRIPYRRGRPYHSNDTCYVEQKNYNIIRQAVGYARSETPEEVALIAELYEKLRLLVNFFYPSVKLLEKYRQGARLYKRYDAAKSPCRRLLGDPLVAPAVKIKLRHLRRQLDPLKLKQDIGRIQDQLLDLVRNKTLKIPYPGPSYPKARERMRKHLFGTNCPPAHTPAARTPVTHGPPASRASSPLG